MTSSRRFAVSAGLATAWLVACSPALDWRESRPEASGATLLFPCRPSRIEREVRLVDASLRMQLHSCTASGNTYSLAFADAASPGAAGALSAWRSQTARNVSGRAVPLPMRPVTGATPNPSAGLDRIEGRLPDGRAVVEHAAFFVKGARIYQAAIVGTGEVPGQEALDNFFGAIRLQ